MCAIRSVLILTLSITQTALLYAQNTDGFVTSFIPDPEKDPDNSGASDAEGVAVDVQGHICSAEVGPRQIRVYEPEQ